MLWLAVVGCATDEPLDPAFQVERTLVQVVAELKAAEGADLYRFDPPRDVTGENLYRASVARLQRMEALGVDVGAQRSVSFAMGVSFLGIGDYKAAAARFDSVSGSALGSVSGGGSSGGLDALGQLARSNAAWARTMAALVAPVEEPKSASGFLSALDARRAGLLDQLSRVSTDPSSDSSQKAARRSLVEVEIERLDVRRREWFWRYRVGVGNNEALAFARGVAQTHVDSRRVLAHLLRVGDMYAELARTSLEQADPSSRAFDPAELRSLVQLAMSVYAEVAAVDGRPERDEARAAMISLETLLLRASPS